MTVKELIEKLKTLDEDKEIRCSNPNNLDLTYLISWVSLYDDKFYVLD